jgi:hypothetical protein
MIMVRRMERDDEEIPGCMAGMITGLIIGLALLAALGVGGCAKSHAVPIVAPVYSDAGPSGDALPPLPDWIRCAEAATVDRPCDAGRAQ